MNNVKVFVPLLVISLFSMNLSAQDSKESTQDVADKLANPAASVGAMILLFDYYNYAGNLPGAGSQNSFRFTFQPSLPYPLKSGYNIFFRPLIPVNLSQPVYENEEFVNAGADLGDISLDLAIGKTYKDKWMGIVGIFSSLPTSTDDRLSSGQVLFGPELAYGRVGKWGSAVLILTQGWSITGNGEKGAQSVTGGQYMYNINLGNAWQLSGSPTFSYNHKATSGNKFTFPIGTGIKKVISAGNMRLALSIQYYYYVARPDSFGPEHQVRISIVPVVKLPW